MEISVNMITLVIDNSLDGNSKKVDCQHVKSAKFVRDEAIFTKKKTKKDQNKIHLFASSKNKRVRFNLEPKLRIRTGSEKKKKKRSIPK